VTGFEDRAVISAHGAEALDEVEPLWLSLFDWHLQIGAAGLPVIDRDHSWPLRRALYEELLERPDSFLLLARRDGRAVGYALAHLHDGADDTWPTSERMGHVESLAVLPEERGRGLGTELLDRAEERLEELGATTVAIEVMVGNEDAQRLYESRGMTPVTVRLLRLGPRAQGADGV
jgi:ribosomal protein S18 acetylase RimI-like enzyme